MNGIFTIYRMVTYIFISISYFSVYKLNKNNRNSKSPYLIPNILFLGVCLYCILLIILKSPYETIIAAVLPCAILAIFMYPFSRYLSKKKHRMKGIDEVLKRVQDITKVELSLTPYKFSDDELSKVENILSEFFKRFFELYNKESLEPLFIFCDRKKSDIEVKMLYLCKGPVDKNRKLVTMFETVSKETNGSFYAKNKLNCGNIHVKYLLHLEEVLKI